MRATATALQRFSPDELSDGMQASVGTEASVLVVEDDADCRHGLSVWLSHRGYDVSTASNGAEALFRIEQDEPNVVILDLGLPGLHGFKILHEVRMRRLPSHVFVVSANASEVAFRQSHAMGASAFLSKPVDYERLLGLIQEVVPSPYGGLSMSRTVAGSMRVPSRFEVGIEDASIFRLTEQWLAHEARNRHNGGQS